MSSCAARFRYSFFLGEAPEPHWVRELTFPSHEIGIEEGRNLLSSQVLVGRGSKGCVVVSCVSGEMIEELGVWRWDAAPKWNPTESP